MREMLYQFKRIICTAIINDNDFIGKGCLRSQRPKRRFNVSRHIESRNYHAYRSHTHVKDTLVNENIGYYL